MPASGLAAREAPTTPAEGGDSPAAATRAAQRPAVLRPTLRAVALGGAQGALLYGGAIALLHARHNTIGAWDALVLLGWCVLIYGAGAAVAAGAVMALLRIVRRLRGARGTNAPDAIADDVTAHAVRRDLWLATTVFHGVFWLFAASYGFTYDEAPSWIATAWPMLGYLVLRSAIVLAATAAAGWVLVALAAAAARRRRTLALLATLALLVVTAQLVLVLAHPSPQREKPPLPATFGAPSGHRVAVVGVDGADWRVIVPMVERGELPTLKQLMAEGSWGPLASFHDSNSAVIWASIYSGRKPAVHGVLDFYAIHLAGMDDDYFGDYPVHRTFFKELALRLQRLGLARVQPIDRSRVAAPLVWEVAHAARRSVGVVDGYYYSYPAPLLGDPQSFFLAYGSDGTWQQAKSEKRAVMPADAALLAWPPGLLAEEGRFLDRPDFTWQSSVLADLVARRGQPDLLTMYAHEPDAVQHEFWRFHEPDRFFGVDARTAAKHDEVAAFYRQLDGFLDRLRKQLGPDTVLVLVSDHGHSPTIFHSMDTQHRHGPPGILLLHGGPVHHADLPADAAVLDVYPTLLYLLGIPVPDDADGRVLTAALDPAYVKAHPEIRVSSWDGLPPPRTVAPADAERRRQELEKLYSLGYIR
ncbi:MAG TPA: alkaline phosphatase family protein [Thermoanaerobaculia bacterium]|nr:alkaline phosphatase family protein [Thermoanaerobaculia bacterium]